MKGPLFRPEVVQARRGRWLGGVVLDPPAGMRALVAGVVVVGVALVALFVLGSWTRHTPVAGQLVDAGGVLVARLQVPESAVRHVAPGDRLLFRYDAVADARHRQHPGRVASVVFDGVVGRQRWFRVDVVPERGATPMPAPDRLLPGQGVRAEIAGDRRPLYRWLLGDRIGADRP